MTQVSLKIGGQAYEIACDDGDEDKVRKLGTTLNTKVSELQAIVGHVGESRLLVMASLLLADEATEAREAREHLENEATRIQQALRDARAEVEATTAEHLEAMAGRIETIAERIQAS